MRYRWAKAKKTRSSCPAYAVPQPVMNVAMYTTSLKKLKGVRPHMLYQNTFYKGLDYSF